MQVGRQPGIRVRRCRRRVGGRGEEARLEEEECKSKHRKGTKSKARGEDSQQQGQRGSAVGRTPNPKPRAARPQQEKSSDFRNPRVHCLSVQSRRHRSYRSYIYAYPIVYGSSNGWSGKHPILHGHWAAQQSDAPLLLQPASGP